MVACTAQVLLCRLLLLGEIGGNVGVMCGNKTLQLVEGYKAGVFIMALGARGIAPPNLHTEGAGD